MDSVGLTIRHIIVLPPLAFQNMLPIDIIDTVRAHYGKTTTRTARRLEEILAEKLDNHAAKMQNVFSIGTTAGIPMDELTRVKLLRNSMLSHHVIVKLLEGHDHDYPEFLKQTFASLCAYLDMHLPNAESRDSDRKAHGLLVQHKHKSEHDMLLSMNAEQITAYLAATAEAKKWKNKHNKQRKKTNRNHQSPTASNSDGDAERPEKKQREELYCHCHGTKFSHTSMECKVMAADKKRFTQAMRKATNSKSPPGGSIKKHGVQPVD